MSYGGASDGSFYFNDSLSKNGNMYDGSDLALKLHCRIDTSGGGSDTIGLLLDYAFIKNGFRSDYCQTGF